MTEEDANLARELRLQGFSLRKIAARLGCGHDKVRWLVMTEEQRAARRQQMDARRIRWYTKVRDRTTSMAGHIDRPKHIPDEVIADWRRRQETPTDPMRDLMGDPPPGRSALDRRRG